VPEPGTGPASAQPEGTINMGCLLVVLAWMSPRFVLAILWAFTDRLTIAFDSGLLGILGFLFLPYTTVAYALAYAPLQGVQGLGWLFVVVGALIDLSSYAGGGGHLNSRRN
jgi:hypothetical protein